MGQERRHFPRYKGNYMVDLVESNDIEDKMSFDIIGPSQILDVSKEGFRIKSFYDVPKGSLMSLVAYFVGMNTLCVCEVRWKEERAGNFIYGLQIKERTRLDGALSLAA